MKLKFLYFLVLAVIVFGLLLTGLQHATLHYRHVELGSVDLKTMKIPKTPELCIDCSTKGQEVKQNKHKNGQDYKIKDKSTEKLSPAQYKTRPPSKPSDICKDCRDKIQQVLKIYSQIWTKNEEKHQRLKAELSLVCNGFERAIVTQDNTPLGSELTYDGDKKVINVTQEIFSTFAKDHPFLDKTLDTCAVVGNGGILANSGCGEAIDSAKCNMPPLEGKYSKDVGTKTDIVTANPSIFVEKYGRLLNHRQPFVDHLRIYGNAMLLTPTFCFSHNTEVLLQAFFTIEDFKLEAQPVSMNPDYLQRLDDFWRSRGLKPGKRLTSGLMMLSLALEICGDVHLYGFWPFDSHPYEQQPLAHHYFDNKPPKPGAHAMPAEFEVLLKLHSEGVLQLHLGQCPPKKHWGLF